MEWWQSIHDLCGPSQLVATVPSSSIAVPTTALITVSNPAPGGGMSSVAFFSVTEPSSSISLDNSNLSTGVSPVAVVTGDFNGDLVQDLAVLNTTCTNSGCAPSGSVSILLGRGDGTFSAPTNDDVGYFPTFLAIGDFNGDGKIDIAVSHHVCGAQCTGAVSVLLGNGDGTFEPYVDFVTDDDPRFLVVGDFNGDGKLDIATSDFFDAVAILLGNGDGTFLPPTINHAGGYPSWVSVGDFNHDGMLDLAVTNFCDPSTCGSPAISVLLGNGDGSLQSPLKYSVPDPSYALLAADFNRDGLLDMVVIGCPGGSCSQTSVHTLMGSPGGGFSLGSYSALVGYELNGGAVGDFNGDGILDFAVAGDVYGCGGNCLQSSQISIFLGNGDATFQPDADFEVGLAAYVLANGDFNGDGRLDFVSNAQLANEVSISLQQAVNGPIVNLSPNTLSFGQQVLGTTSTPQVVSLSNTGTQTLSISSLNVGGADSGDFSQSNNCGTSVPAGKSCQISVTFAPSATGPRSASIFIVDNAPNSPQSIPLSGTGTQPAVSLSPSSLDYGNQTAGIASAPLVSTLTNTGNGTLTLSSIVLSGPNSEDFSQTNNCPSSISPNASCNISVTFKPSAIGSRNATLVITDNAPNSPQSLPLAGVGVLPAVTFSATSLTFPAQTVFSTSPPQKLTLTNTGLGILKISGGSLTGQFGENNNCGGTLAPGASCSAEVTFKPTSKGTLNGTIAVTDNAPGSPQNVSLTGVGTYLHITPPKIDFGSQPIHTTSLAKRITVTNKGSDTVHISSISIMGTDPGDFAQANNCGNSVSSGASCFIKVKFTPSQQGRRTANVQINDDGGGSPQTVALSGTGTP